MIEWSEEMSVGIADIDRDHQAFVCMVNRFNTYPRLGASREEMRRMLADLVSYAENHFVREEAYMRRAGYPDLAGHIAGHDAAAAKIHDLLIRNVDEIELARFLGNFLEAWLVGHILGEDWAFGEWLRATQSVERCT
ncbi:MAG TPA: bacteriohemerythrin [Azospirillum sp.]|nr:bacteriohemerythrin [Azospirillum sp.]